MVGSLFPAEKEYAKLKVVDLKQKIVNITLKIETDKDGVPTENVVMYWNTGYYDYAVYLNKEQRGKLVEYYNKYEQWKKVAYENQVSHTKEIGKINKIKPFLNRSSGWEAANKVTMGVFASVGQFNMFTLLFPTFTSSSNQYIDGEPGALVFNDPSLMDTTMTAVFENMELATTKEFVIDNLIDSNLVIIQKNLFEEAKKVEKLDSLFD